MSDMMELLPHFGARALVLAQKTDPGANTYIRIRTGPRRSQMKSIGRVELVSGEGFEIHDVMREVQTVINDGGSHEGHVIELMRYDPSGKDLSAMHTVFLAPTLEDRTADSMAALETGDSFKALVNAVVTMAASADARADHAAAMVLQLMEKNADHRVSETDLAHMLLAKQPPPDKRMESMAMFMKYIAPLLPTIQRRMDRRQQQPPGTGTNNNNNFVDEPEEVFTEEDAADAFLEGLQDLSTEKPDIWKDPARQAKAAQIFFAMTGQQPPSTPPGPGGESGHGSQEETPTKGSEDKS